jgi:hypothetical protein
MAASPWPWLVVALTGALHGANPVTGWAWAAWSTRGDAKARLLPRLAPIAAGHLASLAVIAIAVPAALRLGMEFDPLLPQGVAAVLLLLLVAHHVRHRREGTRTGHAGLTLWSFIVGIAHGAGWMLVPAIVPLCGSGLPAREITASGSLALALAAVALHMAAMLATAAAMAAGTQHALGALRAGWKRGA